MTNETKTDSGGIHYLAQSQFGRLESLLKEKGFVGRLLIENEVKDDPIFGRVYDWTSMFSTRASNVDGLESKISFILVDGEGINNALAWRNNDNYVVVVFTGLIRRYVVASGLISSTDVIRNYINEESAPLIARDNYLELDRENDGLPRILPPYETAKSGFAVFDGMIGATICHEMAHICHGHLEFINREAEYLSNGWLTPFQPPDSKLLTLQTLEYDADCFGSIGWLSLIEHRKVVKGDWVPASFAPLMSDPLKLTSFLLFSSISSMMLDNTLPQNFTLTKLNKTHTPARYRAWTMALTVIAWLESRGVDKKIAYLTMEEAYLNALFCSIQLLGLEHNLQETSVFKFFDDFNVYSDRIHERWALIRNELERIKPTKFGKLAAAQRAPS